jgi:hypothetical protein
MLSNPKIEAIDDINAVIELCEAKEFRHHFEAGYTICRPILTDENKVIYI